MITVSMLDPALSSRLCLMLVHSLWQVALLAAVAWCCERLLRWSVERRYLMYVAAMITGLVLLPVTFVVVDVGTSGATAIDQQLGVDEPQQVSLAPIEVAAPLPVDVEANPSVAGPAKPQAGNDAERAAQQISRAAVDSPSNTALLTFLAPWVVACYVAGVALMFLRLGFGVWSAQRLVARSRPVSDSAVRLRLEQLTRRLSVRSRPVMAYSEQVLVPRIVGLLRPVILLPSSAMTGLALEQVEMVLAHELTHLRRHDLWVNLLQRVAEAVLFFNPALWYVSHRINVLREYACDDAVCRATSDDAHDVRCRYAAALLQIAELSGASAAAGRSGRTRDAAELTTLAASGRSPSQLRRRIARLVGEPLREPLHLSRGGLLTLLAVAVAVVLSSSLWPVIAETTDADTDVEEQQNDTTSDDAEPQDATNNRVEVIAIGTHDQEPQRWWDASGEITEAPSFKWPSGQRKSNDGQQWRRVVIHIRDLAEHEEVRWELPGIANWTGIQSSSGGTSKPPRGYFAKQFVVPEGQENFRQRVGIASGEWKTVDRLGTSDTLVNGRGDPSFISSGTFEEDGGATLFVSHDTFEHNFRIIAVDKEGRTHDSGSRGGSSMGTKIYQSRARFPNLPLHQIDHFKFQTRPYEWTEIDGLPLEARENSDAVSAAESPNHPSGLQAVQQKRIDSYTDAVRSEDFAALVDNLDKNEFSLAFASADPAEPAPELMFKVCLADRRLSKLYELIQEMPEQERARTAREIFEQKFDEYSEFCRDFRRNTEGKSNNERMFALGRRSDKKRAACAGLFLVFQFCPPAELLECLDLWKLRNAREDLHSDPEPLFVLNLYVLTLVEKLHAGTIDSVLDEALKVDGPNLREGVRIADTKDSQSPGSLAWLTLGGTNAHRIRRERVPWVSWKAHTNPSDITHVLRGAPVDETNVLKVYEVCTRWHRLGQPEDRRAILDHLHQRLRSEIAAQNARRPQQDADETEEVQPAEDENAAVDKEESNIISAADEPVIEFPVVVATNVLLLDGREVITWDELEAKIAALPDPSVAHPRFYITRGAREAGLEESANEQRWRLHRDYKLRGLSVGSLWPRSDLRYDKITSAEDLNPDESLRIDGRVVDVDGNAVEGAEVIVITPIDESISYRSYHIALVNGRVRNRLEHVMSVTDAEGRFAIYPPEDTPFTLVTLHPDGGFAFTGQEALARNEEPIKLLRWASIAATFTDDEESQQADLSTRVEEADGRPEVVFNQYWSDIAGRDAEDSGTFRFTHVAPIFQASVSRSFPTSRGGSVSVSDVSVSLLPGENRQLPLGPMSDQQRQQLESIRQRFK